MKNLLFVSFQFFLKVLDKLFPKSDNIIIFTLNSYRDYQDNVRFLFESLSKSQKIECFLLFYKEPIAHKSAINFYSFNGIILWLRSRFLVVHHGTNDIPFSHSIDYRRRKLINVWHGIPVKNLGYQIKSKAEVSIESEFNTYWSMICSSAIDSLAMQSCFKKPKSDMWLTGLPRNDLLFSEEEQLSKDLKEGWNGLIIN